MVNPITTIDEFVSIFYGEGRNLLRKADAPITTSTTGSFNSVFGAYAWAQLNLEGNFFSVLPKTPYTRSGWRVITAKPSPASDSTHTDKGGVSEGGTISDSVKPTLAEIEVRPKTMHLPFSASEVMEWMATHSQDDIWGGLGSLRLFMAVRHKELMNQAIAADVEKPAADATGNHTGTLDFESLDRIVSADAEEDTLGGTYTSFYDPWVASESDIDRDSGITYDCTVKSASGTIGTNGVLTDDVIQTLLQDIRIAGGKDPTVFIGSHKAYKEIQSIYMPSVRIGNPYDNEQLVQIDVNGVKTFKGTGVGIHVDAVYGLPYIPSKDAPSNADDTTEIGRIFALDTSDPEGYGKPRIGIDVAIPTEYYEATRRTPGYPYINGKFAEEGLFRTLAEVVCRHFPSQGKIRDIKQ